MSESENTVNIGNTMEIEEERNRRALADLLFTLGYEKIIFYDTLNSYVDSQSVHLDIFKTYQKNEKN